MENEKEIITCIQYLKVSGKVCVGNITHIDNQKLHLLNEGKGEVAKCRINS